MPQVVYDLYEHDRIDSTYQSRNKAEAARYRRGSWFSVRRRVVVPGKSPRYPAPPKPETRVLGLFPRGFFDAFSR